MSYCVHCGVELAQSEPDCPLCGTTVQNLSCAWQKPEDMPYPETVELGTERIDRRYARQLMAMVLMVPAFVVLLLDFFDGGALSWSPFVLGAMLLLYCWIVVPFLFRFAKPYAYILIDVASLSGYLLLIALLTEGLPWFLGLVLPALLFTGLCVMGALLAARRLALPLLYRVALVVLLIGLYLIGLEQIIRLFTGRPMGFNWSVYASVPLAAIALMLALTERNKPLKQEIRKRLFL